MEALFEINLKPLDWIDYSFDKELFNYYKAIFYKDSFVIDRDYVIVRQKSDEDALLGFVTEHKKMYQIYKKSIYVMTGHGKCEEENYDDRFFVEIGDVNGGGNIFHFETEQEAKDAFEKIKDWVFS